MDTLSGEGTPSKLFCLPFEKGSTLEEICPQAFDKKKLIQTVGICSPWEKFYSLGIDNFSEDLGILKKKQKQKEVTKIVSIVENWQKNFHLKVFTV